MKEKIRYENVYTKRSVRDPIDWDRIEEIRNEGWEYVGTIGSLRDSILNPQTCPLYVLFKKEGESKGAVADGELNVELGKKLTASNMREAQYKKKLAAANERLADAGLEQIKFAGGKSAKAKK